MIWLVFVGTGISIGFKNETRAFRAFDYWRRHDHVRLEAERKRRKRFLVLDSNDV